MLRRGDFRIRGRSSSQPFTAQNSPLYQRVPYSRNTHLSVERLHP